MTTRDWLLTIADALVDTVDLLDSALTGARDGTSEAFMKTIKAYYPVTIEVDGDPIVVHIARMSTVAIDAVERQMRRLGFDIASMAPVAADPSAQDEVAAFLTQVIVDNVSLPAQQIAIEAEDGTVTEVRTGAQLVAQYGGRDDVVPLMLALIWGENRLAEAQKAQYRAAATAAIRQHAIGARQKPAEPVAAVPEPIVPSAPVRSAPTRSRKRAATAAAAA